MKFLLSFLFLFSQLSNAELYNPPTATPTVNRYAGWDSSLNFSANNHLAGYATTATAAGTTVLTVASPQQQYFTGVTTQTVTLPVASTLVLGFSFTVTNLSTGVVTVNSSGGNAVQAMAANTQAVYTCILASGTSAASWNLLYYPIGVVPIAMGGTNNASLSVTGGTTYYGDGSKLVGLANGSANQFLQSAGGTAAPTWSSTLTGMTVSGDLTMSAGGIKFPATQSASAGANTLDDYEEGTWTPSWTLTSGSVTYANQNGVYTKIGNTVIVGCWIRLASISSPVNASLVLAGLPFAANAGEYRYAAFMRSNLSTVTGQVVGFLSASATTLTMIAQNNGASTALSGAAYLSNANAEVDFFLVYQAAN